MIFDPKYKIWLAADFKGAKPVLKYVLVEASGLVVASNGFILAAVPATLEKNDVPGLVLAASLKAAAAKGKRSVSIKLKKTEIETAGKTYPRFEPGYAASDLDWPAYSPIVEEAASHRTTVSGAFVLNPNLFLNASRAIGFDITNVSVQNRKDLSVASHIEITNGGPHSSLLLETEISQKSGQPTPPFCLIMPCHLPQWAQEIK